jgi:glucose-6-phosphate isomerase
VLQKDNTPVVSELLAADPDRARDFTCRTGGWSLDYARIPLTREQHRSARDALIDAGLAGAVERLFGGEIVNPSERQPALHMALRAPSFQGLDAESARRVAADRDHFLAVADELHSGRAGLTDILHIGIGGSDLGPRLVSEALDAGDSAVRVHWLSTLDAGKFERLCRRLDPERTGLVVASKSFSTEETLVQAEAARAWLGERWAERSWAATAKVEAAKAFGIRDAHVLPFPGWTGGRFSLWSSVGVSAAAVIGRSRFEALLAGAEAADREFASDTEAGGMAVTVSILVDHLRRGLDLDTLGVVSYEPRLALLSNHLQQLFMESLGKGVGLDDSPLASPTVPLIFGGLGTDLQHSIFQALHQGLDTHPLILVGAEAADHDHPDWQQRQLAHLHAQAQAFCDGRSDGAPYQRMPGNRPVATLLVDRLTPESLGWLLATLEQTVFALSVRWGINAFDQWGVEEGKRLAKEIRDRMSR